MSRTAFIEDTIELMKCMSGPYIFMANTPSGFRHPDSISLLQVTEDGTCFVGNDEQTTFLPLNSILPTFYHNVVGDNVLPFDWDTDPDKKSACLVLDGRDNENGIMHEVKLVVSNRLIMAIETPKNLIFRFENATDCMTARAFVQDYLNTTNSPRKIINF